MAQNSIFCNYKLGGVELRDCNWRMEEDDFLLRLKIKNLLVIISYEFYSKTNTYDWSF
jgi:hypothetical protein